MKATRNHGESVISFNVTSLLGVIKYYDSNGNEQGKLNIVSKNNLDEISFKNKMKILLKKYGF